MILTMLHIMIIHSASSLINNYKNNAKILLILTLFLPTGREPPSSSLPVQRGREPSASLPGKVGALLQGRLAKMLRKCGPRGPGCDNGHQTGVELPRSFRGASADQPAPKPKPVPHRPGSQTSVIMFRTNAELRVPAPSCASQLRVARPSSELRHDVVLPSQCGAIAIYLLDSWSPGA